MIGKGRLLYGACTNVRVGALLNQKSGDLHVEIIADVALIDPVLKESPQLLFVFFVFLLNIFGCPGVISIDVIKKSPATHGCILVNLYDRDEYFHHVARIIYKRSKFILPFSLIDVRTDKSMSSLSLKFS